MAIGKRYSTDYLVDSNNNTGSTGQVLTSTLTGIDWADIGSVPGGFWAEIGSDIYSTNSGSVGIGTTSPSVKLEVYQGDIRRSGISSGGYIGLTDLPGYPANAYPSLTSGGSLHFANNGKYCAFLESTDTYFGILDSASSTKVFFATGAQNSYLTGSGNFGIGITGPLAKLHVVGGPAMTGGWGRSMFLENTYPVMVWGSNATKYAACGYDYSIDAMRWWTGAPTSNATLSANMRMSLVAGKLGIGTDTPTGNLTVESAGNQFHIRANTATAGEYWNFDVTSANQLYIINSANTGYLTIKDNGNVGIGTASPDEALDVEHGNIRIKSDNDGNNGIIMLYDSAGTQSGQVYASAGDLRLYSPNDIIMSPTGNVGIGTTTPVTIAQQKSLTVVGTSIGRVDVRVTSGGGGGIYGSSSQMKMFSNYGMNLGLESGTSGLINFKTEGTERMVISNAGAIKFNAYGAGTLVTDASGNITASSGGGAGGPFLPLAGGTMTGTSGIEIPEDFALKWKGTSTSTVVFEINNSGGTTTIQAGDGTNSHKFKIAVGDGGMEINPIGGGSIADFMSNKINLNQNVGIGVGSPDVPLDVTASETGNGFSDGIVRFENTTSATSGGATVVNIRNNYQSGFGTLVKFFRTSTSTSIANISFNSGGTAVNYNTGSDYRLKEDLQTFNGFDIIDNISVYNYKWKGVDFRGYGVLAHELNSVFPDAVTGEKDAEEMQSVDYSKLVPVLIKSIQELKIEIETIKQQLNN